MSGPRVLFLPAYGPDIGGGHALRGFSLAQALVERGAVCGAALNEDGARALRRYRPVDVEGIQRGELLATARGFQADIVVIDDYGAGAKLEAPLVESGFKVVVIDDLADREHQCSLLVDPSFGRKVADYQGLVPAGATVLAGPDYALLRPEFAQARDEALTRRNADRDHRILISLGLTDVGGHTALAAQLLAGLAPLDVVLGSASPSLSSVSALSGVEVHVDASNMAELITAADIGVGAGGVSVWERACLGLPSIVVILADNQARMARALDDAGVVMALDVRDEAFDQRLVTAVERLFSDGELRDRLSRNAAHLCDGRGAGRVADAILAKLA